eukprot:g3011.t1
MNTFCKTHVPVLVSCKCKRHLTVSSLVGDFSRRRLLATRGIKQNRSVSLGCARSVADSVQIRKVKTEGTVLVLFKNDLRIEDHPGLQITLDLHSPVIPFYCLDPSLLSHLEEIPGSIELLWGALNRLKECLRASGSDLVIRVGNYVETLVSVLEEFQCTNLVTEIEVESKWLQQIEKLKTKVPGLKIHEWNCFLYNFQNYDDNYNQMDKSCPVVAPLKEPGALSSFPDFTQTTPMPTFHDFSNLFHHSSSNGVVLGSDRKDPFQGRKESLWKELSLALFECKEGPIQYIREYLKLSNRTHTSPYGVKLRRIIEYAEDATFPGLSFTALFAVPLSLGIISTRQLLSEIQENTSDQSWLNSVFPDPYTKAAEGTCLSFDFHKAIAQRALLYGCVNVPGSSEIKFWRWQGMLTEFCVARPEDSCSSANGITVVLVHGFGASSYHWRRNVDILTSAGYTVFSPTLPGYGRSQKCYLKYSDIVWQEYLTSFIKEIVMEPVVLVGNSVGAFIATQTAGYHPDLVRALILINPAGKIDLEYVPQDSRTPVAPWPLPSFLTDALSRALLFYLSKTAKSTLRALYPVNVDFADSDFLEDILRASKDPNALTVLKSVFFLQKPVPLNYYLSELYRGEVLLLQGALDPLNQAVELAELVEDLRPGITVEIIQAGHCPHDEIPEAINSRIMSFLDHVLLSKVLK